MNNKQKVFIVMLAFTLASSLTYGIKTCDPNVLTCIPAYALVGFVLMTSIVALFVMVIVLLAAIWEFLK